MSAYNCVRMDFVDGVSQYRFYKNPVNRKEYMYGEESKNESDKIDTKIINHELTPFGHGDVKEEIVVLSEIEKAYRQQRSIISSVNRTKTMIYNYARGNVWEWFCTFTFNPDKVDSFNYAECSKKIRQWLNNIHKKYSPDLKYLVIPEQHESGRWHFHGLLSNTGSMNFKESFYKQTTIPLFSKSGLRVYNFGNYKLGFSSATKIKNTAKASSYVTKYITKDLANASKGHRRYYPSANLDLPGKHYFFILNEEKLEFLKLNKERFTYNKEVKVTHGYYENLIEYIEMNWGDENV